MKAADRKAVLFPPHPNSLSLGGEGIAGEGSIVLKSFLDIGR